MASSTKLEIPESESEDDIIMIKREECTMQLTTQSTQAQSSRPATQILPSSPSQPTPPCSFVQGASLLALTEFVATISPPQPALVGVLFRAGVQNWRDLQRLAEDPGVRGRFLDMLVREDSMSRFQSVLFTDTLRGTFPSYN